MTSIELMGRAFYLEAPEGVYWAKCRQDGPEMIFEFHLRGEHLLTIMSIDNYTCITSVYRRYGPGQPGKYAHNYREISVQDGRRFYTFHHEGLPAILNQQTNCLLHDIADGFEAWAEIEDETEDTR